MTFVPMKRLLLPLLLFYCAFAFGQTTSFLDKKVDVTYTNERVTTVLTRMSQQAGFTFSYNASIIPSDQVVTLDLKEKTVREALNEIFKGSMNYKEKGNHVILTKVSVKQPSKPTSTTLIISGYVEDFSTKERITEASVYEKKTITSVVSDEFGFFRIKLEKKEEVPLSVSISKQTYRDTTIVITESGNQYFHISLQPVPITKRDSAITAYVDPVRDTTDTTIIEEASADEPVEEELSLPYSTSPNVRNIRDTLYREFQVSLAPFLGTNAELSGNVINDYSLNIFGGYSLGTKQMELGGFFNVDRGDVSFLQIAGFGNLVGGNVYGIQVGGFFNANGGETTAVQVSGFGNVNYKDFQGVQTAGFANVNLSSANGVQVAGFSNLSTGRSKGVQVSGFSNVHLGDYDGPQVAGFANVATGRLRGSQVAGFANLATGTMKGSQVSGFFNYAHKIRGTQFGFLNYADSLAGVPIGFLSIVKSGYHKIELSADEVFYGNVAFRSGVRKFYNILLAGFKPNMAFGQGNENVWALGYGLGTDIKLWRWLHLNIDATSQHVNKGSFTEELSSLNKLHVGFDFVLLKKLSIYTGATLNGYFTRNTFTDYPNLFTDYSPRILHEDNFHDVNVKMWLGGKIALRFL
jgi:hypothetical protein